MKQQIKACRKEDKKQKKKHKHINAATATTATIGTRVVMMASRFCAGVNIIKMAISVNF